MSDGTLHTCWSMLHRVKNRDDVCSASEFLEDDGSVTKVNWRQQARAGGASEKWSNGRSQGGYNGTYAPAVRRVGSRPRVWSSEE